MDEPTASLGEQEVVKLLAVVRDLRSQGVGVIYISHRLDELFQIADRVTVLRDGAAIATRPMQETSREELIRLMVERELTTVFPKREVAIGEPVIEIVDLHCQAAGVHGVNLTVREGEVVGLGGLVGAGRTELAQVLFGLQPADGGRTVVRGRAVTIDSPAKAIELGIAYVPEDRRRHGVILDLPIAANATLAVLRQLSAGGRLQFGRERSLAREMVQRLSIKASSIEAPANELSGGNQQKVALARWLLTEPKLLILDEPTQGIDVGAKAEIHRLIGELTAQGMAIVMISSEMPELIGMSDRIAVMRGGRIVGELTREQATQERVLSLALGHAAA